MRQTHLSRVTLRVTSRVGNGKRSDPLPNLITTYSLRDRYARGGER